MFQLRIKKITQIYTLILSTKITSDSLLFYVIIFYYNDKITKTNKLDSFEIFRVKFERITSRAIHEGY